MNRSIQQVEDLITDEQFVDWVKNPNPTNQQYWEEWLVQNPDKQPLIIEARQFILSLSFERNEPSKEQIDSMKLKIHQLIDAQNPKIIPIQPQRKTYQWQNIAAVLLLLIGLWGIYQWQFSNHQMVYATTFAERQTVELPDGSMVTLNANSSLDLRSQWTNDDNRELWLDGEAFFKVNPTPNLRKPKFIVHTNQLDVVVLGTQFNVSTRSGNTKVVLTEGKVDIQIANTIKTTLSPNEKAVYKTETSTLEKEKVNTEVYTTWKTNRLFFDKTPLSQLIEEIENSYGYTIELQDDALLNKRLSGSLPNSNLKAMLGALEGVFDIKVEEKADNILIFSLVNR